MPTPDSHIEFVRRSKLRLSQAGGLGLCLQLVLLLLLCIVSGAVCTAVNLIGFPLSTFSIVAIFATVAVSLVVGIEVRKRHRGGRVYAPDGESSERRSRLVCAGCTDPGKYSPQNGPFHPWVTAGFGVAPFVRIHWITFLVVTGIVYVAIPLLFAAPNAVVAFIPALLAAMSLGSISALVVTPSYLRITPGNLEFIYYSPVWNHRIAYRRFDLSRARIVVDFDRYLVCVSDGDEHIVFPFIRFCFDDSFVRRLYEAAVCTAPTPQLRNLVD